MLAIHGMGFSDDRRRLDSSSSKPLLLHQVRHYRTLLHALHYTTAK